MDEGVRRGPVLDRSGEPWVGSFPGLGNVSVYLDGSVDVYLVAEASGQTLEVEQRERALRFGWGEPLSLVRRGFSSVGGSAVVDPDPGSGCLIVQGESHDVALVTLELARRDWSVLGDRLVPTTWVDGRLVAHPRVAPLLISGQWAEQYGLSGGQVRALSDAVEVDVPRAISPSLVGGVLTIRPRKSEEVAVSILRGHERFVAAAALMVRGVLHVPSGAEGSTEPAQAHLENLRLAALPFARLSLDTRTFEADIHDVLGWWVSLAVVPGSGS